MHSFCKLKDAGNDILKELQTFIADNGEHNSETADHFSKALKQKQFYKYNDYIKTAQDSLKTICADVDNVDPDTTMDDQVVNLLFGDEKCISTCKNILSKDEKPKFVQNKNCKVGYFTNMPKDNNDAEVYSKSDETDINNKQHKCGVSVAVQTDYNDSFVANEPKVNQEESSSDEIQKDYPAITISFEKEEGEIGKIIPVSDRDAWVLTSKKLKKIKNLVLENTTYAKADDFVVLKDGSVLVLNHDDRFIKKLLPGGRLVPFSFMDSYYPRSLCLTEKSVFINLCYFDCNNTRIVLSKMNSFDFTASCHQHGICLF
ncbi:unnamed protein product [Mytilus edulis]|uniref:Uncharacterized protein n=1 Tax=Mytilus edulis TaxID=6550 RepID=A0A8S3R856_MYTED|nr:unnamed protein product [Mytilus edulis]